MRINEMLVNHQPCPLGLDDPVPSFSWSYAAAERRPFRQTSYRIVVADTPEQLRTRQDIRWDSGIVDGSRHVHIPYEGVPLQARQRYYWHIQAWDEQRQTIKSDISWWEMGLLWPEDWQGCWISSDPGRFRDGEARAPLLRTDFAAKRQPTRARLYVCGLGHYELRLNGRKVGDCVLDPGWTNYDKTCLYTTYDVTEAVHAGANTIGILLGNGFYHVAGGRYAKFTGSFGQPKCIVQLELEYADGSRRVVASGDDWRVSESPLTFNCIYGGEDYDARLEQAGWDAPHFRPRTAWQPAFIAEAPKGRLRAQTSPALKIMRTLAPVSVKPLRRGVHVADFGQNFSGWVELRLQGMPGAQVKLIPGELLHEDGSVSQDESGKPYEWNYILRGEGIEVWRPRFTYYGFRYVQIEQACPDAGIGAADPAELPELCGIAGQMIYPDMEPAGRFFCSDSLLQQTHDIIERAIVSNMKSVMTDCPHREKLGWLEQLYLMGPSISCSYPFNRLIPKIMNDIRDAQLPDGMVPTTAPEYLVFDGKLSVYRHSVSWGAAYIRLAWHMYAWYGDISAAEAHYREMQAYIAYILNRSRDLIVQDGLGDWYDIGEKAPGYAQNTPVPLTETALFYDIVRTLADIASALDRSTDAEAYARLGQEIKSAYNRAFFDPQTCQYATGSQSANAMSLALGLVEEDFRDRVLDRLIRDIERRGYHTTAGDVGHRYVLQAVARHGRSDVICRMTDNTDHPSYGYQIVHGATTLTEAWDGPTIGRSQNHLMLGHLMEWLYGGLAGIRHHYDRDGICRVTVAPYLSGEIRRLEARRTLPAGEVSVGWTVTDDRYCLQVTLPFSCEAAVCLPSSACSLTEGEVPLDKVSDIRVVSSQDGRTELSVRSGGTYTFHGSIGS